jgi:glycosyltransferase involved in cell wall biosynthesis
MRLCHIVPSLEERHGGPSKSVRALANAHARLGATTDLLATAVPVPSSRSDDAAQVAIFPREFPQRFCPSRELKQHLLTTGYDCVHHHSLWLRTLHYAHMAAKRFGVPLVIAPRGMMSGWAYRHHRWRKSFAEHFVHPGVFRAATGWHATSDEEAEDIRRLGFTQPVCVAPNGVVPPTAVDLAHARSHWQKLCPATKQRPVAVFYSRFHRKKRLRELLDLWLGLATGDWLLLLVGLPEEYTVAEINGWIAAAGAQQRVAVFDGTGQPPPYAVGSLFLLPSHSENFGLVVAEALTAGLPVLTTDATPWRALPQRNAGWCIPWAQFPATLAAALTKPISELAVMGTSGRVWATQEFTWERSGRLLLDFYQRLRHD